MIALRKGNNASHGLGGTRMHILGGSQDPHSWGEHDVARLALGPRVLAPRRLLDALAVACPLASPLAHGAQGRCEL